MKFRMKSTLVTLLGASALLSACTTPTVMQVESENSRLRGKIAETIDGQVTADKHVSLVNKSPEIYAVGKSFVIKEEDYPKSFERLVSINRTISSMDELLERFSMISGVPVVYKKNLATKGAAGGAAAGGDDAMGGGMPGMGASPVVAGMAGLNAMGGANGMNGIRQPVSFNYQGTFVGLLDLLTTKYGYYWRFKEGRVYLYETDTRVFEVAALPGDVQTSSQIGVKADSQGGSGAGGAESSAQSSAQSSSTTSASNDIKIWDSLERNVKQMLTAKGTLSVSPSTGNITVTDTPEALDKVERYLEGENRSLSRQVALSVKVLSVETKAEDDYGINWENVTRLMGSGSYSVGFQSNNVIGSTVPNVAVNILKGNYAGASALISAISKNNKINSVTNFSAITLNNQPVPVNVGNQKAYLSKIEVVQSDTGTTTSLEPGKVTYGTTINMLPRIMKDGTILMQMSMDLSDLIGITTFGPTSTQIQLPEMASKTFLQRAALKSGEVLVLSGFESTRGNTERSGIGAAEMPLLGGRMFGQNTRASTVVIVQPVVLDAER